MPKNEERIDALEQSQARLERDTTNAAQAIRDQKTSLDKLLDSLGTLGKGVTDAATSIRWLQFIIGVLAIPMLYSAYVQWSVHTTIGQLDERTKTLSQQMVEVRGELTKIKEQKGADVKAIADAAATLAAAAAALEKVGIQAQKIEQALRGPDLVTSIALTKDFTVDTSEGDAVLAWDGDIAGIPSGRRAQAATVIHISAPTPAEDIPDSTVSVTIRDDRKMRILMAMSSQEDRARVEKFFRDGGTMSLDVAIYLATK
jgi:hypothetical protein